MLEHVIDQRRRNIGGFEVGRVLPAAARRMIGPFVFFDHMGPVQFAAGLSRETDVRPHPHIGLSTITYLFAGEIMHRDSVGSAQPIRPGEVNWMTAGRGITHSERFEKARAEGDFMHGIQAWVALPEGDEETDPAFAHHGSADLPQAQEGGLALHLIAGKAYGLEAQVKTHSPMFYAHLDLVAKGVQAGLPDSYSERALYVASGSVEAGGRVYSTGQMLVFGSGSAFVTAREPTIAMALGGEPLGPRYIEWNFVSSSRERIEQAKADWRAGRMKLPDFDHDELIPLPGNSPNSG